MAAQIPEEVHGAALPRRPEHLRECGLEARMRGADRQLDADEATRDEAAEKVAPERLGLRGADIEADDLPPACLMDGVRDDDALARDPAAVSDLLDLRVDEQNG
jgi:hypothetical protein